MHAGETQALLTRTTGWKDWVSQNSWTAFGSGYNTPGYYKDALGFVHLRGRMTGGTIGLAFFVLPTGYRPAANEIYPAISNGATAWFVVSTTGEVQSGAGSNADFSIDGATFMAAL